MNYPGFMMLSVSAPAIVSTSVRTPRGVALATKQRLRASSEALASSSGPRFSFAICFLPRQADIYLVYLGCFILTSTFVVRQVIYAAWKNHRDQPVLGPELSVPLPRQPRSLLPNSKSKSYQSATRRIAAISSRLIFILPPPHLLLKLMSYGFENESGLNSKRGTAKRPSSARENHIDGKIMSGSNESLGPGQLSLLSQRGRLYSEDAGGRVLRKGSSSFGKRTKDPPGPGARAWWALCLAAVTCFMTLLWFFVPVLAWYLMMLLYELNN